MWRSIYLFIASSLVLVSAQTQCPFGTLTVGSNFDGTPICDECIVSEPSCAEWFNCENTHDPRCNLLNCTEYVCNSDEVLAHGRFCVKTIPPGEYVICQNNDNFNIATNTCEHISYPPAGSTCVEPERPYTAEDGTVKCVSYYSPRIRSCPSRYYMSYEGSDSICFTGRPAECAQQAATPTARPEEPSSTATAKPEEPTQTAKPNPCHCHEPFILVQEKHCLWPERIEQNNTNQLGCNSGDSYIASMEMCRHVIEPGTSATSGRICPDGFEQEQHSDGLVCVKYYEPLNEPCSEAGTYYIHEGNRLGLPPGCYRVIDAMCESMSETPKPEPSKTSSSVTPRPEEPSKTSSITPKPSERSSTTSTTSTLTRTPRRSSTPTMTPRREEPSKSSSPSGKPMPPRDICAEDPRNPRCVKPESILNQFAIDAVISPLSTPKPPMEPVVSMRPAPIPTPWPVPQEVVAAIRPEDIPPYIPSRVSFTDGDPVQFEEPQKIQEVQASIACTLRMPLEKIRIETITILTLSTGQRDDIQIDPSEYLMSSNGTVVCYEVGGSGRLLRSRRLQNTDIQVDIDYLIVEPPVEILALNTTEFATIIRSSPAIQSVAQSVGSSGVASEVTVASYSGIQVPQSYVSTTDASFKFPTYGIGVLGGVGGLAVLAGFIGAAYYFTKKTKKQASPVQSQPPRRVVFVDEMALPNMPRPMLGRGASHSTRTLFNPLHASNAV